MNRPNYLTEVIKTNKQNIKQTNKQNLLLHYGNGNPKCGAFYMALSNIHTQGLAVTNPDLGFD